MLRNLSKYYLFICCKQSSSTHFCHFLATAFVTDVLAGSNPMHRAQTKTVPLRGPFPNQWWAMRDVRVRLAPPAPRFVAPLLACCAGKRFAFPQLRTLSGSNPMRWAQTKTVPLRGPFPIRWWAMRDVRVRLAPPALASGLRPSRAALENASRFLSSAPFRVRIPLRWAQKRKAPIAGSLSNQWWAMRDSNPQPCACKAPALTVAPIARAERV